MLMGAREVAVDVADGFRIVERLGEGERPLQELDRLATLGSVVIITAHQSRRERKRVGLRLRVELRHRLFEVHQPARVANRHVGLADLHLECRTPFAGRDAGERLFVALDRARNDAAGFVDVADGFVEGGHFLRAA
jgi:hypothetical protein